MSDYDPDFTEPPPDPLECNWKCEYCKAELSDDAWGIADPYSGTICEQCYEKMQEHVMDAELNKEDFGDND